MAQKLRPSKEDLLELPDSYPFDIQNDTQDPILEKMYILWRIRQRKELGGETTSPQVRPEELADETALPQARFKELVDETMLSRKRFKELVDEMTSLRMESLRAGWAEVKRSQNMESHPRMSREMNDYVVGQDKDGYVKMITCSIYISA